MRGRFGREGRRLTFAPPAWYDVLVVLCLAVGVLLASVGAAVGGVWIFYTPMHCLLFGGAIALAGVWASLSNERILFDLTQRGYVRLEGQGLSKRLRRGRLEDLDALQLLAEEFPVLVPTRRVVVYRLVLHWKGKREPLLVVEREDHSIAPGAPFHAHASGMAQRGAAYAKALGVPFYDNSYYHSPAPLPVV